MRNGDHRATPMKSTKETLLKILSEVHDPEIPVLNIVEMGIVRDVEYEGESVRVDITPTYSGCPAMKVIQDDIVSALNSNGYPVVSVNTVYTASWTTDWMDDSARQKLHRYGVAPAAEVSTSAGAISSSPKQSVACPRCGSIETELISEFSSTACKALYRCKRCIEPFEYFKPI